MSKKKVFFLSYLVFAMSLFSNLVSAAPLEGAFSTIRNLFGFLPDLINLEKLLGGDTASLFWAKFLVWVLLFAILYFGTTAIPRLADNKRIATVIALTISLISTLLIPNEIITNIFQTYGLVAGMFLWFIPLGALLYLNHVIQVRWLRALILFLALIILMNINATLVSNGKLLGSTGEYFGLLLAIVLIMFFWNLFAAFGGEARADAVRDAVGGWAGDRARDAWDWATGGRGPRPRPGPRRTTIDEARIIREMTETVTRMEANYAIIRGIVNGVNAIPPDRPPAPQIQLNQVIIFALNRARGIIPGQAVLRVGPALVGQPSRIAYLNDPARLGRLQNVYSQWIADWRRLYNNINQISRLNADDRARIIAQLSHPI